MVGRAKQVGSALVWLAGVVWASHGAASGQGLSGSAADEEVPAGGVVPAPALEAAGDITVRLEPERVEMGRQAELVITIERPEGAVVPPELPVVDGLRIFGPRVERSLQMRGGQVEAAAVVLRYGLLAGEAGRYVVPALRVEVGGQVFEMGEQVLEVTDAAPVRDEFLPVLKLKPEKTVLWAGETVELLAELYVDQRAGLRRHFMVEVAQDGLAVERFPTRAQEQDVEIVGGLPFYVLRFWTSLAGLQEGSFQLGPGSVDCEIEVRTESRGFPGLFGGGEIRRVTVLADPVEIEVKPLPLEGRPEGFAGAVGQFYLDVNAGPTRLMEGEPIDVELVVSGKGNLDAVQLPRFTGDEEEWRIYPGQVEGGGPATGVETDRVVFRQTVVPLRVAEALPGFALAFFDPRAGEYVELESAPIRLVMAAREVVDGRGVGGSDGAEQVEMREVPGPELGQILGDIGIRSARRSVLAGAVMMPVYVGVQILAGGLFLALCLGSVMERWRRRPRDWMREGRRRLAAGQERLSAEEFYGGVARLVDRWERESGSEGGQLPEVLREAVAYHEREAYGGGVADEGNGGPPRGKVLAALGLLRLELFPVMAGAKAEGGER
jgi:hypothetical protein